MKSGQTGLLRLAGLALGFGTNALTLYILTKLYGPSSYAMFAMVASLLNLLPFADLGMGASVINVTADHRAGRIGSVTFTLHVRRVRDRLVYVMLLICGIDVALYLFGGWAVVLGSISSPGSDFAAFFTILCLSISLPFGLGARILQGADQMRTVVALSLIGPIVQLAVIACAYFAGAEAFVFGLAPGTGYVAIALITFVVALKRLGLHIGFPLVRVGGSSAERLGIAETALPFLIISVGLVVNFQSHRLLLAHFSNPGEVASYSLVAQFTGPLLSVIGVMSQNLWPSYRTAMPHGIRFRRLLKDSATFAAVGLFAGVTLTAVIPTVGPILTNGTVGITPLLLFGAVVYCFTFSLHQPFGMFLNDPRGLWLQASTGIISGIVSLVFMFIFIPSLAGSGPYLIAGTSTFLIQTIPAIFLCYRRLRRGGQPQRSVSKSGMDKTLAVKQK